MLPPVAPGSQWKSLDTLASSPNMKTRIYAGLGTSLDFSGFEFGGAERDRTADLLVANSASEV